ncbi:MAG: hypothetical protein O3A47_02040 [Chloroflexi bacterium]|nr:hypothetical protein [Chloroflexota bacterium]
MTGTDSHRREIEAILDALGIPEDHAVSRLWLALPGDKGLHSIAHREALAAPRPVDGEFVSLWDSLQWILDFFLQKFEETYLEYHAILDELLIAEHPTRKEANRLRVHTPNNVASHSYFFDKLTSPEWLEPLTEEGFFRRPSQPERDGDSIRFVPWPQARYLVRIAREKPTAVADVILAVPQTENVIVLADLAEAACEMPAEEAVRLVERAKEWASGPYAGLMLLHERIGRLVAHLAEGGYVAEALDLARAWLALKQQESDETTERGLRLPSRPRGILNDWDYKEILRLRMPVLVRSGGLSALVLLCDLLDEAISVERTQDKEDRTSDRIREDYSQIWRPHLELADRPGNEDIQESLVGAARDASLQIVGDDSNAVSEVVKTLESHGWAVFWRLSLDVLREVAPVGSDLACERLCDVDIADEYGVEAEYLELLKAVFPSLKDECRAQIYELIRSGPDTECLREHVDKEWYIRRWRWKMLAAIKAELPPDWDREWSSLSAEFGVEPEIRREGVTTGWVGPAQAVGVDRLNEMAPDEIAALAGAFKGGDGFDQPSEEDLGREIGQSAASSPERFTADLCAFDDVDLTYKGGLVRGFRDAAEADRQIDWKPVLEFCQRVLSTAGLRTEPDAAGARREIIDLLHSGLAPKGEEIPIDQRELVWSLLALLQDDPDPTQEREDEYSWGGPYGRAINTNRGRAIEAVIYFAIWVYRRTRADSKNAQPFSFDNVPGMREVLERHLDVSDDASLAVRGVYGKYLPTLAGLDREWVTANLHSLFPHKESETHLRRAVWEAYAVYARIGLSMLDLLRGEYEKSVNLVGSGNIEASRNPDVLLGQHLLIFYWHGRIDLDDQLLVQFFEIASDDVRAAVTEDLGQGLRGEQDPIADEVGDRLRLLWEWRIKTAQNNSPNAHKQEMASFGRTFSSGKLGDAWALERLEETLSIAGEALIDHQVAERLASLAPEYPETSVGCLSMMIEGARENWQIHHWAADIEAILRAALGSGDEAAMKSATILINKLVPRGFPQYSDQLGTDEKPS